MDTYALVENFDDEFDKDPMGFQAKVLQAQQRLQEGTELWDQQWDLIEREGQGVPEVELTEKAITGKTIDKCHKHCKHDAGKGACSRCMDKKNNDIAKDQCRHAVEHAETDTKSKVTAYQTCKKRVNGVLNDNKDAVKVLAKCKGNYKNVRCLVNGLTDVCLAKDPVCKAQNLNFHICKITKNPAYTECCDHLKKCVGDITKNPNMADQDNLAGAQGHKRPKSIRKAKKKEL